MKQDSCLLVTGGAGFIGSNFVIHMLGKYPGYKIINLDLLTYAGRLGNLAEVTDNPRYSFVKGDIGDCLLVEQIINDNQVDGIINFAAESHVDNSLSGPAVFIKTNIEGCFGLLDTACRAWMEGPHRHKAGREHCRYYQISTDEVYGSLGAKGMFDENSNFAPNSPYSASKASADLLVRSYHHSYGVNVLTSHCTNNYGPRQHNEKLIPTIIKKALANQAIPIYGDGSNVRDWIHVDDHCRAIDLVLHRGKTGRRYNIGANNEMDNLTLAHLLCSTLDEMVPRRSPGKYSELITLVSDRPGHDRRYAIDASRIKGELGWEPKEDFANSLRKTVEWYLRHDYE